VSLIPWVILCEKVLTMLMLRKCWC